MVDLNLRENLEPQRAKVARELDKASLRSLIFYAVVGFLFALLSIIYCWERQSFITRGYRLEQLKQEQTAVDEVYRKLLLDRATLRTPQRIDAYAREQLGLAPPPSHQIIFRYKKASPKDDLLALGRVGDATP